MYCKVEREIAGKTLAIETGRVARQCDASVLVSYGDTVVFASANVGEERGDMDFFPFFVDFRERYYAGGFIFGSRYDKREGRPTDEDVLTMRMIDRPLRPFFPPWFRNETQLEFLVLSAERDGDPPLLGVIGGAAALLISSTPFNTPIGTVRVGQIGGEFVLNPSRFELENSAFDLLVCATTKKVVMIECGARSVPEETVLDGIRFGFERAQLVIEMLQELAGEIGRAKIAAPCAEEGDVHIEDMMDAYFAPVRAALTAGGKAARDAALA